MIGSLKVLSSYSRRQFDVLKIYLYHRRALVTPQVLAEVSNLSMKGINRNEFRKFIESCLPFFEKIGEEYIEKGKILEFPDISRYGFTDVSILLAAKRLNAEVVTEDIPLNGKCKKLGINSYALHELFDRAG